MIDFFFLKSRLFLRNVLFFNGEWLGEEAGNDGGIGVKRERWFLSSNRALLSSTFTTFCQKNKNLSKTYVLSVYNVEKQLNNKADFTDFFLKSRLTHDHVTSHHVTLNLSPKGTAKAEPKVVQLFLLNILLCSRKGVWCFKIRIFRGLFEIRRMFYLRMGWDGMGWDGVSKVSFIFLHILTC